jgi:hypothetical protein
MYTSLHPHKTNSNIASFFRFEDKRAIYRWRDVLDTALYDKVCQWRAGERCFSPGSPEIFFMTNWLVHMCVLM